MKIFVYENENYAWCELPDGKPMYGRNVPDICKTLDEMFKNASTGLDVVKAGGGHELSCLKYNR